MNDNLGIGSRPEAMTLLFQLLSQLDKIIDFPVAHQRDGLVLARNRLIAGFKVDDAQAPDAHPDSRLDVEAVIVRTPMSNDLGHSMNDLRVGSPISMGEGDSANTTHDCSRIEMPRQNSFERTFDGARFGPAIMSRVIRGHREHGKNASGMAKVG
jgi:hypothetical protein